MCCTCPRNGSPEAVELGDVAVAAGALATARGHYQASLDIRERLAAADPANTGWQHDLEFVRQRIHSLTDGSQ